jgi:adenosylmethionine-8-amino-7-oxononanoate aminotransferase
LKRERLVERCASLERFFFAALEPLRAHLRVGDIRGKGLLAGIELVADREAKEPLPRDARFAERLTAAAFARGLLVWPNVGHADGERGDLVMLAPPFTITEPEIGRIAELLLAALEDVS